MSHCPARWGAVRLFVAVSLSWVCGALTAQEQSVNPGLNDSFRNPDVQDFVEKFEIESREVFHHRTEIVAACKIQPGQTVADIGAGTGLFTRLFADAVGKDGRVIAVDISQKFLDHILRTSRETGRQNIDTLLCTPDSTALPPDSVDVAFICDTYHHFEFPQKTMASLYKALKPGGRVILIDFRRVEGESSDWVLSHVRAGQEVFENEITRVGFRKSREVRDLLAENYVIVFEKPHSRCRRVRWRRVGCRSGAVLSEPSPHESLCGRGRTHWLRSRQSVTAGGGDVDEESHGDGEAARIGRMAGCETRPARRGAADQQEQTR